MNKTLALIMATTCQVNSFEVHEALEKMRTIGTYPLFRSHNSAFSDARRRATQSLQQIKQISDKTHFMDDAITVGTWSLKQNYENFLESDLD